MIAIYEFRQKILPNWLQFTAKYMECLHWKDLKQYDLFVSIIKGSDNIANHAIGIYNNWMFDANEKIAIPLYQERLDDCVSTEDARNKFVSFIDGFFFKEIVWQKI